jgi:hypothetical protein
MHQSFRVSKFLVCDYGKLTEAQRYPEDECRYISATLSLVSTTRLTRGAMHGLRFLGQYRAGQEIFWPVNSIKEN